VKVASYLSIAVVGDQDLVNGLRMGGLNRYHIVSSTANVRDEVRNEVSKFMTNPEIGVIVILEDYADYIADFIKRLRDEKKVTPVVVAVPSKMGAKYADVRAYYKGYIKDFIGFDLQI
jgi:vacuolar-type H+-ATPase subunit F/Vma7